MKCQSCGSSVEETLKASISSNFCPYCGKNIMTPQVMQMKNFVSRVIFKFNLLEKNSVLNDLNFVDRLSSSIATEVLELSSEFYVQKEDILEIQEEVSGVREEIVVNENSKKGYTVQIPENLKPKKKSSLKPVTRQGSPLPSKQETIGESSLTMDDLSALEESFIGEEGDGALSSMDDSDFFNQGDPENYVDEDGNTVVLGVSDPQMHERAQALLSKHVDLKERGLINVGRRPIVRA